jgi:hypothetical protein
MISCSCNPKICKDAEADYYASHPSTECRKKSGESAKPKWANLPRRVSQYDENIDSQNSAHFTTKPLGVPTPVMYENNLCAHQPIIPRTCKHPQGAFYLTINRKFSIFCDPRILTRTKAGMLGGRKGTNMEDLYVEEALSYTDQALYSTGRGLFVHGGNAIYQAEQTSQQDILHHGVMKQSPEDLGGHHLVLKVTRDAHGEPYMLVDRIPLSYPRVLENGAIIRVALTEKELLSASQRSSSAHGNFGWLANLEASMGSEQALVD